MAKIINIVCPYCKKPSSWSDNPWKPFCSERCKMIDLGKWAMGDYRVAGEKISKEFDGEIAEDADEKNATKGK